MRLSQVRVYLDGLFTELGDSDEVVHLTGLELGADDYLQKPVSRDGLVGVLQRWTGRVPDPSLRILLVDDDPVARDLGQAKLTKAGYTVVVAGDGQAAVEAVRREPFDAVLMDVAMPVMDGLEATAKIRTLSPDLATLPIIALSAHAAPERSETYTGICW